MTEIPVLPPQSVGDRFGMLIKALGMNNHSFAKSIGKNSTTINYTVEGKTKPSFELFEAVFTKYPKVNRDWLLMGEGRIFRDDTTQEQPDNSLITYLRSLEEKFDNLLKQMSVKDQQIAGLQRTVDALVGKSEGVALNPVCDEGEQFEVMMRLYKKKGMQLILDQTRTFILAQPVVANSVAPRCLT